VKSRSPEVAPGVAPARPGRFGEGAQLGLWRVRLRSRSQSSVELRARANVASIQETVQRVPHQGNTQIVFVHSLWRAYIMKATASFSVRPGQALAKRLRFGCALTTRWSRTRGQ
jgi:hypothetical protein